MNFPIKRSKSVVFFVCLTLAFMFVYPLVMIVANKEQWMTALIGMGLCFLVNVPLVWEVFIKKHKVENGVLKYGVLNDDIVLKDIRVVRQVGKHLEITTNAYKVHMVAMPQDRNKFLTLIEKENPNVKIEMVGKK
ncbi:MULTISPECIES: PH domain-containing protein [unclassified Bacillus cereus group]|uniref:PH domain-containing protein n=1 Tax=Bacillus cereus group TaxID=86661 RepID=UPI001F57F726|nr:MULTISPECIES: PH domain-containing protein [unclassified Bacillus cereus group]MDA1537268.1 PH domain-containing protein [Bacillus cereus group sp. TH254-2LC]MDA1547951.1 PH domain-containing protein [Bacillus cereus group sp. TH253LC]MDA1582095.1 PH domain-containing protein [Bacillus cereus group sp. TH228LC]MDA1631106.1 PH domain-containing protein [Bacillus cereus group sp. TH172LC]MDA1834962.1 PH domain-containing protein [Bacillus cereus group sp. BY142LC]